MSGSSLRNSAKKTNTVDNLRDATGLSNLDKIQAHLSMGVPKDIEISLLNDFPEHKYRTYDNDNLKSLAASINQAGLAQAITVMHDTLGEFEKDKYFIIAGHNRKNACKFLGWEKIPCIVKDGLTKAEAKFLVNTNLDQRGKADYSLYDKCQSIIQTLKSLKELEKENKLKEKTYGNLLVEGKEEEDTALYFGLKRSQIFNYKALGEKLSEEWFDLYPKHWDLKGGYKITGLSDQLIKHLLAFLQANENSNIKLTEKVVKVIKDMDAEKKSFADIDKFLGNSISSKGSKKQKKEEKETFSNDTLENVSEEKKVDTSSPYVIDLLEISEFNALKDEYDTKDKIIGLLKELLINFEN